VVAIEAPTTLPVDHLSLSSIRLFSQCPERWRRRYLDREYEPPSGKMILGSAAGAAEARSYSQKMESGEAFSTEQVLDEFDAEYEDRIAREEIKWDGDVPGELKDSGLEALRCYHEWVAPEVIPVSVERPFELSWPGLDWNVIGYMDVEDFDGAVRDLKMRGKRMSKRDADSDLQPTLYLAARRAEGNPATEFRFDTMIRATKPFADVIGTERTDQQLDQMFARIFGVAREMVWRTISGNWSGAAPGTWFCGTCSYSGCPYRLGPEP
jgi:hypothetical protein